jgi:HEPN domain-containing protein
LAEKALKGFLYSKGYRALITQSVTDLLEESSKLEGVFRRFVDYGKELESHYIISRYPNFYPKGPAYKYFTEDIAEKMLKLCRVNIKRSGEILGR